ncbi:MAG: BNR repeat-containing protein [Lacipirellulaceae bacterium]
MSPLSDMLLDSDALILPTGGNFATTINGQPYQQEALITHGGYQYAAWYHNSPTNEDIYLSRRDLTGTTWETFDTGFGLDNGDGTASSPNREWDSHNVIGLGISGDGRIHLSFDHHVDSLRYVTTNAGAATGGTWNSSILNAERDSLNVGGSTIPRVTYPRFANVGDDLVLTYRDYGSGNGDHRIADYNSATGQWSSTRFVTKGRSTGQVYDDANSNPSSSRNSYHNGFHFDSSGRLHTTWNWREGTQDGNHDIMYAYSDDKGVTWRNNDGQLVGTNSSPITLNSPGIEVVDLDRRQALLNQQGQIVDPDGGVHALMFHRTPGHSFTNSPFSDRTNSEYFHYYRDPQSGTWDVSAFPAGTSVGSRPRISVDSNGHLYGLFTEGDDLVIAGRQKVLGGYDDWEILHVDQTYNYDGTPLVDNQRLLDDGILSVFIQEEGSPHPTNPTSSPLRVLEFSTTAPPVTQGTLIAGWDTWQNSGVQSPNVTDGITTGTSASSGFGLDSDMRSSTDGTWGTLNTPAADGTADDINDAARLANGASGYYDFTVTDTGGIDRDLTTFHFDAATFRPNSARDYELSVLSGDLTVGSVATGNVPSFAGGQQDWSNFDIDLTGVADNTLDANGTVTFRLNFTGGTLGAGGHHQGLDNVAIAGEVPALPSTLIAGWDRWASNGIQAASVTDGNTTATTGNNVEFGLVASGNTDGTWGTLATPTADQTTDDSFDGYRLVNGEEGSIEFTLTDSSGVDRDLTEFHFDTGTFRPDSSHNWELSVISGDLTLGSVASGDAPNITGGTIDWHDFDIDLTGLADNTLDANGTVTFLLEFTGGTLGASGHHQYLDNVAISGTAVEIDDTGDFDGDGDVDGADFLAWQRDTIVGNLADWQANYGTQAQLLSSATAVPEPSSLILLSLALAPYFRRRPPTHRP